MTTARLTLLAVLAALGAARPAAAQTFTWDGGAGSGSWSSAANWSADTLPPAGGSTTTAIVLAGTVQTVTNQDRGNPFVLNTLTLDPSATNGFTVGGNPLQFGGTTPTIVIDGGGTAAPLLIDSATDFGGAAVIDIQSSVANSGSSYDLALRGRLSGSGTILKQGVAFSDVVLTAANGTYVGTFTNSVGSTFLGAVNAFGRGTAVDTGPSATGGVAANIGSATQGAALGGYSQQFARLTGTGSLQIGSTTNTAVVLTGFDNGSNSFAGAIQAANAASEFGKVGTGALTYTGANATYAAALSVRDGGLVVQGAGRFASAAATVGGTQVLGGATLQLNNSATVQQDRLQDNGAVSLSGGTLNLTGNASTNISETIGGLRLLAGESRVAISQGTATGEISGRGHRFVAADLTPVSPTATLFLRATNLGATDLTGTGGVGGVTFATAPTGLLVGGGGAAGSTTVSIFPFATGAASSAATDASGFITYVGTDTSGNSRTRLLDAAEYAAAFGTATDNVSLAGATTVNAATVANSLRTAAGVTLNAGLTITSGAVLATTTSSVTGTGPLQFGPGGGGSAYVSVVGGSTLTFSAPTTAARLAKSGLGTLTVQAPVTLGASPTVAVNTGTLAVLNNGGSTTGGFTAASGGITYQVSKGATLDVSGAAAGLTVGTGSTVQGNGTVAGTLTVGNGGTVIPSSLGGAASAVTSPGVLVANGNTRFLGGGTYRWHLSSYLGGEYTQSGIAGTGGLDLTDASLSAANPFVVRPVSLTLQNDPGAVYDFDSTQTYSLVLGTFAGGITGFSADKFTVNTADFANSLGGNVFTVAQSGNSLVLNFSPVPEPGLMLGVVVAGLAAARRLRRSAFVS